MKDDSESKTMRIVLNVPLFISSLSAILIGAPLLGIRGSLQQLFYRNLLACFRLNEVRFSSSKPIFGKSSVKCHFAVSYCISDSYVKTPTIITNGSKKKNTL